MKVLVTGASGFLGRHVVTALRRAGHEVRALLRASSAAGDLADAVEVHRGDLVGKADLGAAVAGAEVVIHLAVPLVCDPALRLAVATRGTRHLVSAMARTGTQRLVLASSLSVYDPARMGGELSEASALHSEESAANDAYALAKLLQERVARNAARRHGLRLTVLRPALVWGRGRLPEHALGRRAGPVLFVVGPSRVPPLVYVENCAEAFAQAAEHSAGGGAYNIVDEPGISAWRWAAALAGAGAWTARVPVPQPAARAAAALARHLQRQLPGARGPATSLLVPARFDAQFLRARSTSRAALRELQWRPRFGRAEAVARSRAGGGA